MRMSWQVRWHARSGRSSMHAAQGGSQRSAARPPPPPPHAPAPRVPAGQQRGRPFLTALLPAWLTSGGRAYFDLSGPEFSRDEQLMAYGVDGDGSEVYTL